MSRSPSAPQPRSLAPKEHGAYGQIAIPALAALAMGSPGVASVCFAAGAALAFAAHEPLLVVLGARGGKAARDEGRRAKRRFVGLGAAAAVTGAAGMALAPFDARLASLVVALLALGAFAIARAGAERTAAGEIFVGAVLSGAAVPVALSAGVDRAAAGGIWLAWAAAFAATTFGVRGVIAHARAPSSAHVRAGPVLAACALAAAPGAFGWLGGLSAVAMTPILALALGLAVRPPPPRRLRTVGWALVAATVLAAALLVAGVRGAR